MRGVLASTGLALALALSVAACSEGGGESTSGPPQPASYLTSTQYGVELPLAEGWGAAPATEPWDGGDIDHTAPYVDRIHPPGSQDLFILGAPTSLEVEEFAAAHAAWLTASRGCSPPAKSSAIDVDGNPALLLEIHCANGVFGPTLVIKAISVAEGEGLIITSFTPDGSAAADTAAFSSLVGSISWSPDA